jgi:hypothetical protein
LECDDFEDSGENGRATRFFLGRQVLSFGSDKNQLSVACNSGFWSDVEPMGSKQNEFQLINLLIYTERR